MARTRPEFSTIRTEGAILPADILRRIAAGEVEGVRSADYGLPSSLKLNEAISSAWTLARAHWAEFVAAREALGDHDETATVTTRQKWLQPLLEILGFGRLAPGKGQVIEEKAYPIQFLWRQVPMHLLGCRVPIDRRSKGVAGAATGSPHSLVQEFLNRSPEHLWAIVSNGLQWRLLRDNHTLSRQAYVEFDLETMMQSEVYSDFALFWMLCHASRFEGEKPEQCRLESWSRLAVTDGVKILGGLRTSVTRAIEALGQGFIGHPDNHRLRERLRSGDLSTQELYREVLRQIYRLLFLFVAEDRDLLHAPEVDPAIRAIHARHYSTRRLREMADRVRGTPHDDLWHLISLVFSKLGSPEGCPELGLPSLGSFLWDAESTRHLNAPSIPGAESFPCTASIDNEHLLSAIRALAYAEVDGVRRIVDYRNLGAEELGSVYEGLLELVPTVVAASTAEASRFELRITAGNDRKQSGSYYTPDSLVQCLLDSALEPVVAERLKGLKSPAERAAAILSITVCDPAVGSGHFLIAAAHRLAAHLARHRTGDQEPAPEDYRSALREVIRTCLFGIDINPMAAELCRVSLWIESMEPGKPLSFLEHHIRVGNSLVGVTPELLAKGIPDGAFTAIEGDDKKICSALKKRNKQERDAKQEMFDFGVAPALDLSASFLSLPSESEDTIAAVSRRRREYAGLLASDDYRHALLVADAWCAAFYWRKDGVKIGGIEGLTQELLREIEQHPERFPPGDAIRDEIDRLAAEHQFFHVHLAFSEVYRDVARHKHDDHATQEGFNCIVGNPPFLNQLETATASSASAAAILAERTAGAARGYADLSATFLSVGVRMLRPGGRLAMVQPQSLLAARDAAPIRRDALHEAALTALWISNERVFEDAQVYTCAPTLQRNGPRRGPIARSTTSAFVPLPERTIDQDRLAEEETWSHLAAAASGVPELELAKGPTVELIAMATADFRDQYYGLDGFLVEDAGTLASSDLDRLYPPIVTTGLIDLAECNWGAGATRILKVRWDAPRVDRRRMAAEGTLDDWMTARLVPKVILATQTKVLEVFVDESGRYLPSIPLITIVPLAVDRLWHVAAAVASPVCTAIACCRYGGVALSVDAIKLSAKQVLGLPLPTDQERWTLAAHLLQEAHRAASTDARRTTLAAFARAATAAYSLEDPLAADVTRWWLDRLQGSAAEGADDDAE